MKLSKSLLSAMAVGIALGTSSCSLGDIEDFHDVNCAVDCEIEHSDVRQDTGNGEVVEEWFTCPACGMG